MINKTVLFLFFVSFFGFVKNQWNCDCPPNEVILPDGQRASFESQKAICNNTCTTTIHAENASEVVLFTFTHIPEAFMVEIYDGATVNPSWALEDCEIEDGKQCYSSGNEVTFVFIPRWSQGQSMASVELFLLATSKEHAQKMVKLKTKSVFKKWQVWVIVSSCLVGIILIVGLAFLVVYLYKRKRAKEQLKTMQSCMIFAVPKSSIKPIEAF